MRVWVKLTNGWDGVGRVEDDVVIRKLKGSVQRGNVRYPIDAPPGVSNDRNHDVEPAWFVQPLVASVVESNTGN